MPEARGRSLPTPTPTSAHSGRLQRGVLRLAALCALAIWVYYPRHTALAASARYALGRGLFSKASSQLVTIAGSQHRGCSDRSAQVLAIVELDAGLASPLGW